MIVRVRRYLKTMKGRIFSVAASTRTVNKTITQSTQPLTHLQKRGLAKKGLERSRIIQDARSKALGWRVK